MRKVIMLLLATALLGTTAGCSLFSKSKPAIVKFVGSTAQKLSVKHLGCDTGDAVREDIESYAAKILKVKSESETKSVAMSDPMAADSKSTLGDSWASKLCSNAAYLALSFGGNWISGKLPDTWQSDNCSLDGPVASLRELTDKLCGKLDKTAFKIKPSPHIKV